MMVIQISRVIGKIKIADADVFQVAVQYIGAVAIALHPGGYNRRGGGVAGGDVLRCGPEVIALRSNSRAIGRQGWCGRSNR
jgi:hypothetical protein